MTRLLTLICLLVLVSPSTAWAQDTEDDAPPSAEAAEQQASDDGEEDGSSTEETEDSGPDSPFVSGELDASPKDEGYGEQTPTDANRFPATLSTTAPVDEPMERSSMADRNILVPAASTPSKGTWILSSYNLLVNHLTYAVKDDIALTLGVNIPLADKDLIGTFSSKFKLVENQQYILSVQPFASYANGIRTLDTSQFGLGSGLLFDLKVHDSVMLHFSAYGFANLVYGYNELDTSQCGTRSQFGEECLDSTTELKAFPAGGHWISGSAGITYFFGDSFSVHGEFILAAVSGTFFGVEYNGDAQDAEIPEAVDRDPFEDPTLKSGFPHGSGPTWSLGMGYAPGDFSLQLDVVFFNNVDDPSTIVVDESQELRLVPVASAAYAF